MTLAETYACAAGVPLGLPQMIETFFPLDHPLDRVILIHAFAGGIVQQGNNLQASFPSKVYDYFGEVVELLKPVTEKAGYKIYQIGGANEPVVPGVESLVGKTTEHQCAYLVNHCALLFGNDSLWSHVRGAAGKPQVHAFGSTGKPHFPHWHDPVKCILIESHRGGGKPSFASAEQPKTLNYVRPEDIANAVLRLLLPDTSQLTRQSLFFGDAYNQHLIELAPDSVAGPQVQIPGALVVRMDYAPAGEDALKAAQDILVSNLRVRPCAIVTNRELNLSILTQLKGAIVGLRVEIDSVSPEWIRQLRHAGIPAAFFSNERDEVKLRAKRLAYYDACLFDHYLPPTKEDFIKGTGVYLNKELDPVVLNEALKGGRLRFSTKKFLLSGNKVYLSKAHWQAAQPTVGTHVNNGAVLDTDSFWEEQSHFWIYRD